MQQEDLYIPKEEAANKNPLKISTTDDFEWLTGKTSTISLINSNTDGTYTYGIEIFGENPITNPDAPVLASGTGVLTTPFTTSAETSIAGSYVYVRLNTPTSGIEVRKVKAGANRQIDLASRAAAISHPALGFNWPEKPSESCYPNAATGLAPTVNLQTGNSGNYLINSSTLSVNLWSGTSNIYVSGTVDMRNKQFYVCANTTVYILPGGTLILPQTSFGQQGTTINVCKNATFISSGHIEFGYNTRLNNRGRVEAQSLAVSSSGIVYNDENGAMKIEHKISAENYQSTIVNDGEINAAEFNTAGSGRTQNNGTINITGTTLINSNDNVWENNGAWTTGNFEYYANSKHVTNNCRLIVNNLFKEVLGDGDGYFANNGGAYVECRNLYANNSEFHLGTASLFKVNGTATFHYNRPNRGFIGAGDDYAVLKMNNAVAEWLGQGYTTSYTGNIIVESASHFAQGYSGQYPYINMDSHAIMTNATADYVIEQSECNPGYNTVRPKPENKVVEYTRSCDDIYAFEDQWPDFGDFDMNDIIFRLNIKGVGRYTENMSDTLIYKATITPTVMAYGADNDLTIGVQFDALNSSATTSANTEKGQSHPVVVFNRNFTGYMNVDNNRKSDNYITLNPIEVEFPEGVEPSTLNIEKINAFIIVNNDEGSLRKEIHLRGYNSTDLAIKENSKIISTKVTYCSADNFPWGLRLNGNCTWKWPNEHISIAKDYERFVKWVTSGGATDTDWYHGEAMEPRQ